MEQNSTTKIFIKSLYEKISIPELSQIANSTREEILEQKAIYKSFIRLHRQSIQPTNHSIQSILTFSKTHLK